jgi:hypothetical protein
MATLQDTVNIGYCNESGISGTGLGYCPFDVKRLKAIWRFPMNFKFPANFDNTKANVQKLVQEGKLTPIYKTKNTAWNTPENGVQTFEGGDKVVTDKLPYELSTTFTNGYQYHQTLVKLAQAGSHSFVFVDEDDNLVLIKEEDGTLRGVRSEFFNVGPYMPQGNDSAMTKVEIQLNDRKAIDNRLAFIKSESYTYSPEEITGIVDLQLSPIAPSAATTPGVLRFKANQVKDGHSAIQLGLDNSDIKVTEKIGVALPVTIAGTLAVVGEDYVFTRTVGAFTIGSIVSLETYDTIVASSVINVNDTMVRAIKVTTVTVA